MTTKNKQRVTMTSKPAPESLKLDQRRYLTKRLDSVFNPIIQELVSKARDARYHDPVEIAVNERKVELGLAYLASCEAGSPKIPHGCTLNKTQRNRHTTITDLVILTNAELERLRSKWAGHTTILQDALLLVQRDRQLIADKILLFRDSTAIADLHRCEMTDYFKEAETAHKAKQKQLSAGGTP